MVSEFLKKKLLHAFTLFFDMDKSGNVDKSDLKAAVEKITKILKLSPGDAKYKEIEQSIFKMWDGMMNEADADKDGQVTPAEWVSMWEAFAKNPSAISEWQSLSRSIMFKILDVSNDGSINHQEFTDLYGLYGFSKDEASSAFKKASKGKDSISLAEYQGLWTEYFSSEDPNSPGNFILGKVNF